LPIIKNFCLQLQFQYPQFLWFFAALALLALLFFAVIRWKKKVARRIGEARLVQQLTRNFSN
jgi:Ca-activated chloride channel family protein